MAHANVPKHNWLSKLLKDTWLNMYKIPGLDGIRGIAVILVMLGHLHVTGLLRTAPVPWAENIYGLFASSRGVQIFFVLSGFLITHLLIREAAKNDGQISLINFYIRRTLRIFPLYFLFCAMAIAMELAGNAGLPWEALPHLLTFTFNFVPNEFRTAVTGHIWSIAIEEQFYLVWPIIFSLTYMTRRNYLVMVALAFIVASIFATQMMPRKGVYNYLAWTIPAGAPIAIGCLFAILIAHVPAAHRWLRSKASLLAGIFLYVIPAFNLFWIGANEVRSVGIGLALLWVYFNKDSLITRALEFRPLAYIGQISYGLYIWHVFFVGTGRGRFEGQTWPPDQMTGLVLLILVAPLSWHGFEKPILALKSKLQMKKRSQSIAAQTVATTLN